MSTGLARRCTVALLAFGLGSPVAALATLPASERQALLDLYAATGGASWIQNAGWNGAPGSECDWVGVQCDASLAHVIEINLQSNGLSGELPSTLSNLAQLRQLYLNDNALGGSLPSLSALTHLSALAAARNHLSGTFPSLAGLHELVVIYVPGNQLGGAMPAPAQPNELTQGASSLCPNRFDATPDLAWDDATGSIPWYAECITDTVFANGFDDTP